jgi:hypothetical protein
MILIKLIILNNWLDQEERFIYTKFIYISSVTHVENFEYTYMRDFIK